MDEYQFPWVVPGNEIKYVVPATSRNKTMVWYVPMEPRMRITRAGEPRRDWKLLWQTGSAVLAIGLLVLLLFRLPPARPVAAAKPTVLPPIARPVVPQTLPRNAPYPVFYEGARPTRVYTVPPAVPVMNQMHYPHTRTFSMQKTG